MAKKHSHSSVLQRGKRAFEDGDYVAARRFLEEPMPDSDRPVADDLVAATLVDRATLAVGGACLGLLGLVVLVTSFKQP